MAGYCSACGGIPGRPCSACDGSGYRKPTRQVDIKAARLALAAAEAEPRLPGIIKAPGRPPGPGKPIPVVPLAGLKAKRQALGYTLERAGQVIGVTKAHYRKIEAGLTRLDVARAVALGRVLGLPVESFLEEESN